MASTNFSTRATQKKGCPVEISDSARGVTVGVLGQPGMAYYVPPHRMLQIPSDLQPFEQLVLCPFFDPNFGMPSCQMGGACRLVHADVRGLVPSRIHINFAWRTLEEVVYPLYPAGEMLNVAPPHSRTPTDIMDSGCVLVTRALASKRRPLTHCAHYYLNRQCNMGSECRFVHAVYIDPLVTSKRRAPAPVQLGRPKIERPGLNSVSNESIWQYLASTGDTIATVSPSSDHPQPAVVSPGAIPTSQASDVSSIDETVSIGH
jgi:hypothetical protein